MNIEHETQTKETVAPAIEAGTLLKNKRESLGLTQKQISDRLKLRVTLIQQIEETNLSPIKSPPLCVVTFVHMRNTLILMKKLC